MHIAVFLDFRVLSGAEKRSAKIARALIARGHRVTMFMTRRTHKALAASDYRFDWPPIVTWSYPRRFDWLAFGRSRLTSLRRDWWRRVLGEHGVDVAHVYLRPSLCAQLPVPHLFEITSPDMARDLIRTDTAFPLETILYPNSETVDAALGKHFAQNPRFHPPHAFFDPAEPEGFEEPPKENLVVFAHRLIARKNPVIFAKAAARFLAARPGWRVAVRGSGELEGEVRSILSDALAAGRATLGYEPNLMDELHRSRIFVSIESEDNYSNQSVLEAMWCRNALVLSDRGRTRARYFAENGVLCEPGEDSVLEALLRLTEDPDQLQTFAENGRRHVETAFPGDAYLDDLERVYRFACQGSDTDHRP
ncbi:glycosyltransferase [Rhodobacterales bacterium HKCCSP123]|nr:glycosyltransferase [Rhodobacterales bacterium HKCCSP123]